MKWREKMLSIAVVLLVINVIVFHCNGQSTIESFLSSLPTFAPTTQPGNMTEMIMDLDHILTSVNKTDTVDPTNIPFVKASIGERAFMHAENKNYTKESLMNRTLRLVIPKVEPPYVNYINFTDAEVVKRGYGPGVVIEILKELSRRLNLTYELIPCTSQQWGSLENGNWTGAFGMIYRNEADILGGAAIMQYDRGLITDLTYPFQFAPTAMLIRSPEKFSDNTWLIVTAPFKWEVWILTGISIIASGVVLYIFVRLLTCANEHQFTMMQSMWIFFSVTLQQRGPLQPRSWTCRVLLSLWWMAAITLMATFTGSLVALFAVNKTTMPFYSIQQLVKLVQNGHWQIVMDGTTTTRTNMIKESESQTFKDLWTEMSVNRKVVYVQGMDAGIDYLLANPNYVLLGPYDTMKYWAAVDCRLKRIEEGILPTYLSIPFAKDSEYSTYASSLIRDLVERGFIEKWINDYISIMASIKGSNKQCNTTNLAADKYLDLSKAQGAFWVLCGGLVLGLNLFIVEIILAGIRTLLEYYYEMMMIAQSTKTEEKSLDSKNSKTTSSIDSGDTGGEPAIIKDKEIDNAGF